MKIIRIILGVIMLSYVFFVLIAVVITSVGLIEALKGLGFAIGMTVLLVCGGVLIGIEDNE